MRNKRRCYTQARYNDTRIPEASAETSGSTSPRVLKIGIDFLSQKGNDNTTDGAYETNGPRAKLGAWS